MVDKLYIHSFITLDTCVSDSPRTDKYDNLRPYEKYGLIKTLTLDKFYNKKKIREEMYVGPRTTNMVFTSLTLYI